jgi:hypothetical protein
LISEQKIGTKQKFSDLTIFLKSTENLVTIILSTRVGKIIQQIIWLIQLIQSLEMFFRIVLCMLSWKYSNKYLEI